MTDERSDDFYVNYLPWPARLRRFVRIAALAAILAPLAAVAVVAVAQRPQPTGVFEFGVARTFEGTLLETPVPALRLDPDDTSAAARLVVVGFGKHGIPEWAEGHHGARVRFTGSLVYREGATMIEMNDRASFTILTPPPDSIASFPAQQVGLITVTGEIVDTKCYFGVMRPATGKIHRACAVRCLSGGVPPGLLVRERGDDGIVFLLAGEEGRPFSVDPEWAALTVRATGMLEMHDGLPVLRVREIALQAR